MQCDMNVLLKFVCTTVNAHVKGCWLVALEITTRKELCIDTPQIGTRRRIAQGYFGKGNGKAFRQYDILQTIFRYRGLWYIHAPNLDLVPK